MHLPYGTVGKGLNVTLLPSRLSLYCPLVEVISQKLLLNAGRFVWLLEWVSTYPFCPLVCQVSRRRPGRRRS